jgi:hypothetical protein
VKEPTLNSTASNTYISLPSKETRQDHLYAAKQHTADQQQDVQTSPCPKPVHAPKPFPRSLPEGVGSPH